MLYRANSSIWVEASEAITLTDFVAYATQDGFELCKYILDLGTWTARIPV
ncbi:MAG: hypothetical protein ACKOAH_16035 [Pirellula sp.]